MIWSDVSMGFPLDFRAHLDLAHVEWSRADRYETAQTITSQATPDLNRVSLFARHYISRLPNDSISGAEEALKMLAAGAERRAVSAS